MIANWIDVNNRTPTNFDCVFIKHKSGALQGWYNPKCGWCSNGRKLNDVITHWLELI